MSNKVSIPPSDISPVTSGTVLGRTSAESGQVELLTAGAGISIADGQISSSESGGGAPIDAAYITKTPNVFLTNSQALSALSSGVMRVATTTGAITSLGDPTTVGLALMLVSNPSAITFPRVNANNTVSLLSDAQLKTALSLATIATTGSAADLGTGTVPAARMPALTGDITTPSGSVATTLATVNGNVGTFGNSTNVAAVTVNAKGQITAVSNVAIAGGGSGDLLAANNLSDLANAGTARTNLGVAIGTNVQAYDADLTTWAGITPGSNVGTFLATPSGANLATALTTALPASKGGTGLTALAANVVSMLGAADNAAIRTAIGLDNYTPHGAVGATQELDATTAWHSLTLDADTTLTIINWATVRTILLEILQDATGSRTITWPAGVLTPPTIDSAPSSVTLVTLSTRDGGTTIYTLSSAGGGDVTLTGTQNLTNKTLTAPIISGISTSDGASVTTPNALGALAIDVTKGLNTKTISAPQTFTFSGTPATANTWFSLVITNSDASAQVATIPSSYSMAAGSAITTVSVPGLGKVHLIFRYDGSAYFVYGDPASAVLAVTGGGTGASTVEGAWVTLNVPASTAGGTVIDWALSRMHARTLAANTTFTFANAVDGQEIRVALTNTASNYTVTWPTVLWPGGVPPVQTIGAKTDVYTFKKIGSSIYGSVIADYS